MLSHYDPSGILLEFPALALLAATCKKSHLIALVVLSATPSFRTRTDWAEFQITICEASNGYNIEATTRRSSSTSHATRIDGVLLRGLPMYPPTHVGRATTSGIVISRQVFTCDIDV